MQRGRWWCTMSSRSMAVAMVQTTVPLPQQQEKETNIKGEDKDTPCPGLIMVRDLTVCQVTYKQLLTLIPWCQRDSSEFLSLLVYFSLWSLTRPYTVLTDHLKLCSEKRQKRNLHDTYSLQNGRQVIFVRFLFLFGKDVQIKIKRLVYVWAC